MIKDDFLEDLYFDYNIHKFLGPVLQKVNFAPQVRHLRDGFNAMCDFPFPNLLMCCSIQLNINSSVSKTPVSFC